MTLLELVNDVLRGLREEVVPTWTSNPYARMIAGYVNAVKEDCEAAWHWHDLRHDVEVNAVPPQTVYDLTDTTGRTVVLAAYNQTHNVPLQRAGWRDAKHALYGGGGSPVPVVRRYAVDSTLSTPDRFLRVRLLDPPTAAQTLQFTCYTPSPVMSSDSSPLAVPALRRVIVEGAIARARHERGEDGGGTADQQAAVFRQALADAIAVDSRRDASDLVWVAA